MLMAAAATVTGRGRLTDVTIDRCVAGAYKR